MNNGGDLPDEISASFSLILTARMDLKAPNLMIYTINAQTIDSWIRKLKSSWILVDISTERGLVCFGVPPRSDNNGGL